ncbi:NADH-quinone oxidoreductase subunit J [Gloeobacter kilaueensis]|uniref:NADH-quinone oxidoreductase subunit J n=1 Tax=Gloeobacter kilaueensis (strain ATCC BAA-2537 / CCAP 1431/1 / ULC 316 / JS1) TaxID=1183438 RepID=U5QF77_GLOK1|nr:NADH-quinone oxidoreductase subunit J [Gloeobacter kilaueensis]AGY57528.1 NADH dehydrogenase subunit J [Gloeobacter kilaueensis JS1]
MALSEGVQLVSFVILTAMVLGGAAGVVLFRSMVHSAFLLGLVFIGVSGLYVLLNADFVAAAQVLIYVGAVNVLILFAIMLVNKRIPPGRRAFSARSSVTGLVCAGLFALLATSIFQVPWQVQTPVAMNTVIEIGKRFFSEFLLPFEVASVLLLLAMVGAIILAQREFIPDRTADGLEPLALPERPREDVDEATTATAGR